MRRGVDLHGAVVVLTGASSGIGRAAARRFAGNGARLVLAARGAASLEDVAAEHHLASWGHALLPRTYGELAPRVMRFAVIGDEPSPHDPGNVLAPQPHLDAVRGGWRNRPARIAVGVGTVGVGAAAALAAAAAGGSRSTRH